MKHNVAEDSRIKYESRPAVYKPVHKILAVSGLQRHKRLLCRDGDVCSQEGLDGASAFWIEET